MSTNAASKFSKKEILGWVLTIFCTILILTTKDSTLWTNDKQVVFLAITVFFIMVTAFELVHNIVIALLLPFSYLFFKVAAAPQVFSAWAGMIPWVVLAGFVIANVLSRTGLLNRLVYWVLLKTGCGYRGIIFGFAIAGIATELLTSNKSYLIMPAIAFAVCNALGIKKGKASAGIFLAAALGAVAPAWFIYAPAGVGNMFVIMGEITPLPMAVDYSTYLLHNWPMIVLYFLMFVLIPILFKPETSFVDGKEAIKKQLEALGSITKAEKYGAAVSVFFIFCLITTTWHHIDTLYIFVLWVVSFFIPHIGIAKAEDLQRVNFTFVLFITAFIAIGSAAVAVDAGQIVSATLTPILAQASNSTVLLGGVFVLGFAVNIFMTPLAAVAGLTVPLTQIGLDLNLSLIPLGYVFHAGLNELLFPYEIVKYLTFYAFGMFTLTDFVKLLGLKAILALIFILVIMVPYWSLIGLM